MTFASYAMIFLIFLIAIGMMMILTYKPKVALQKTEAQKDAEEELVRLENLKKAEQIIAVTYILIWCVICMQIYKLFFDAFCPEFV